MINEHYLALSLISGIGHKRFTYLYEQFSDLSEIFRLEMADLQSLGLTQQYIHHIQQFDWARVESIMKWASQPAQHVLSWADPTYPALLKEIADPPPVLYVRGQVACLSQPQIAMVGSRNPSPAGEENAYAFAKSFAAAGWVVCSGLALGVDGCSHQGVLDAKGITVAVAGTGLDICYPVRHKHLITEIQHQGALVSELPPGVPPKAANFPRRNRIISGLSVGVLVVEAARKSGSLITARCALEQNREVFAIPGSIQNPLARGCHQLLRQGAKLVETAQDVIVELRALENWVQQSQPLSEDEHKILSLLTGETMSIDALISGTNLTATAVSAMLFNLELQGLVQTVPGGYAPARL